MLRRIALASVVLGAGCHDPTLTRAPALALRDASGATPSLTSAVNARIEYEQDRLGGIVETVAGPVSGGAYDLDVDVSYPDAPIFQRVEIDDAAGLALIGGTPWLDMREPGPVDVIVGAPGTCAVVPDLALAEARDSASAILMGKYLLVSGGTSASGPSSAVDRFDLATYTRTSLPPTATPLGPSRATLIDATHALVLSDLRPPYIQQVLSDDPVLGRPEPVLHPGAETSTQVGFMTPSGGMVIGGGTVANPSAQISFVIPTNQYVFFQTLPTATFDRAAGAGIAGLWVVSHSGPTARLDQIQTATSLVRERATMYNDGGGAGRERHGAHLIVEPLGMRMALIGGVDQNGVLRTDTVRVTGCPTTCGLSPGPTWTNARLGAAVDTRGIIAGGEGPSAIVERVKLPPGASFVPVIEPFATLTIPRSNPAVVVLPSGPVLVIGGVGASGRVAETEICFPPD